MEWIINNWYLLVAAVCVIAFGAFKVISFLKESEEAKIETLKHYLRYIVVECEKDLGSKTGQLKLNKAYSLVVKELPWVATLVTFEEFSMYVDEALIWMRNQLENNLQAKYYVEN